MAKKLPQGGKCRGSIRKHAGKLQAITDCTIPATVLKPVRMPTKVVKRVSLPAPVREECKGTKGKERKNCIKTARAKLKLEKHEKEVAKYEELGKEVPARLYEKGEKLQARYNVAGELYEIS